MSPLIDRTERFGIRASTEEIAMLQALADDAGLSSSDIVRQLIRAAYKDKFGDKKPKLKG